MLQVLFTARTLREPLEETLRRKVIFRRAFRVVDWPALELSLDIFCELFTERFEIFKQDPRPLVLLARCLLVIRLPAYGSIA